MCSCIGEKLLCCQRSRTVTDQDDSGMPVDRGWAWVIAAACAGLLCLIAGTFKCFGILKLEIQRHFPECGEDTTLWMLSACSIVSLLAGPIFSWLVTKTSHRAVGMIGGSLCSFGILVTAFAPNCYFMFFSLSIVYSMGTGGIMVVVFSAFADYFSRHRGLAVGLVASGSGLGGLVIPKLFGYLFDVYSFKEALLFYAGIYLQSIVLAALLRPTSYYKTRNAEQMKPPAIIISSEEQCTLPSNNRLTESNKDLSQSVDSVIKGERLLIEESFPLNVSHGEGDNNDKSQDMLRSEFPQQLYGSYGSIYSSLSGPFVSTLTLNDIYSSNKQATTDICNTTTKASEASKVPRNTAKYNWRLWFNAQVLLIGILVFFAVNSINLVFTTTPSFAEEQGIEVNVVTSIMTVAGCGEIFFRVFHGWVADRRIFSALTQICIVMTCCTIASVLCATLHGLAGISIMYTVMSLCGTTIFSLMPILIIEQIGKECLVTSLGIFGVYQAVAFIVSTVVANNLKAKFHTWAVVFYYIGACYLISTVIGLTTLLYGKISARRSRKSETRPVVVALT